VERFLADAEERNHKVLLHLLAVENLLGNPESKRGYAGRNRNRHGFVAVGVLLLFPPLQFVLTIAHDDDRRFALGGGESLRSAVTVATLRHDRIDFRQAWENARDGTLCDVCGPVAIDGTDDLEFRMLLHAFFDAGMDIVIDRNTGKAANFEQVAAIR